MKDRVVKPQFLVVGVLIVVSVLGGLRAVLNGRSEPKPHILPVVEIEVRVIQEYAAAPGKVIHAKQNGMEVQSYVCTANDASVAVISATDKTTGMSVIPWVQDARDPQNREYQVKVAGAPAPACMLILQRTYAEKPTTVAISMKVLQSPSKEATVTLSKFAEPLKILSPPSAAEAAIAEKEATAFLDEKRGLINFKYPDDNHKNTLIAPHILAMSYSSAESQGPNVEELAPFVSTLTLEKTEAIKVRFDKYRYADSEVTLTYHNAKIVSEGERQVLTFPTDQRLGTVADYSAALRDLHQRLTPAKPGVPALPQEIYIQLTPVEHKGAKPLSPVLANKLSMVGVFPTLDSMGIDALRIKTMEVTNGQTYPVGTVRLEGFDRVLKADRSSKPTVTSEIPEFKFKIRVSAPVKVSSKTLILPVHHIAKA